MAEGHAVPGLGAEDWMKMWDGGWSHHDHASQESSSLEQCSHDHEHEEEHEHDQIYLQRNLKHLTGDDTAKNIFVSLCGDSKDMEWLCAQGYSVVGAELSETAVKRIFNRKDGEIPHEVVEKDNVKIYSATDGKNLKIYIGNFFADPISPENLGTFDCIWDSHGIVSLPLSQHEPYAKKLATFLKPKGKILFSTVDYDVTQLKEGPAPAPVPATQLQKYYPESEVKLLESEPLAEWELEGVEKWNNLMTLATF